MINAIGIVSVSHDIDQNSNALMLLCASYKIPAYFYCLLDIDTKSDTVPAQVWTGREYKSVITEIPLFSECNSLPGKRMQEDIGEELSNYFTERTILVENHAIPKVGLSKLLLMSELYQFAIPTYSIADYSQATQYTHMFKAAILKPDSGKQGREVYKLTENAGLIYLTRDTEELFTEQSFLDYQARIAERKLGKPIIQPFLNLTLDADHAVDFRLLVSRGGTGDWELVADYARIGAKNIVSNVSQGGYIGDTDEILHMISPERAASLKQDLMLISRELPKTIQSHRKKTICCLGIDVGIDRDTFQPYILEANTIPGTKYHLWNLAEKKVQYFRYLLDNH